MLMGRTFAQRALEKTRALPACGKTIGTHSGTFQADEALACWFLRQLPEYAGATVIRSRDPAVLEPLEMVFDVGAIYDPEKLRFDHHQRGFFETVDGKPGGATCPEQATGRWKTKLSACGLIYKHYGRNIIEQLVGISGADAEVVWAEVYDMFVEEVDAIDNGVEVCEGNPRYKTGSDISSRVARLNPRWNETSDHDDQCKRFEVASSLCGEAFLEVLEDVVEAWLPARAKVKQALMGRGDVHPSGQVILLESGGLPWKEHLYTLEKEEGIDGHVKFVLFTDQGGMWRIQAVTKEGTAFTNRLSLPEPWCGLRDEALVAASGVPGGKFVHANGFIGGNATYEGVISMASKALEAAS